jgi:hypothetical protein
MHRCNDVSPLVKREGYRDVPMMRLIFNVIDAKGAHTLVSMVTDVSELLRAS